MLQINNLS